MSLFTEVATPAEKTNTFAIAKSLYSRYLKNNPSLAEAAEHEMHGYGGIGFQGVEYSLYISVDGQNPEQNGIFWQASKTQEEIALVPIQYVPLTPRAMLISLSVHFGLNTDILFSEACNLRAYWEENPEDELTVPPFKKSKGFRFLVDV